MTMSKEILGMLVDLIENKLSCMQISDRDDMREVMMLQRALGELSSENGSDVGLAGTTAMPKRGRRRKMMVQESGQFSG